VVLVHGDAEVACWPLQAGLNPDLSVVDQLARLQLAARRLGCSLRLRGAPSQLRELIDLAGLSDIVTDAAGPVSADPGGPAGEPDDGRAASGPG
jgi:STAS domain